MKTLNAPSHPTTYELHGASRPDDGTSFRPGDLHLDLVDVMLDLDPGALVWAPTRNRVVGVSPSVQAG